MLDMDRRQVLQDNLKRAEIKRQQKLFDDITQHPSIHVHVEEVSTVSIMNYDSGFIIGIGHVFAQTLIHVEHTPRKASFSLKSPSSGSLQGV